MTQLQLELGTTPASACQFCESISCHWENLSFLKRLQTFLTWLSCQASMMNSDDMFLVFKKFIGHILHYSKYTVGPHVWLWERKIVSMDQVARWSRYQILTWYLSRYWLFDQTRKVGSLMNKSNNIKTLKTTTTTTTTKRITVTTISQLLLT